MLPSSLHQRAEDPLNSLVTESEQHNGPMGEISTPKTAHKATRKFHAIWCLSHSVLWSSWINHQWMMNHQSSILYHFPLDCPVGIGFPLVLVERWRTEAFSRWGILRPALRKKGIHKLIASWSSVIAHPTMDNACVCQSCDSRTVLSLRSSLSWTTQLQELHP